MVKRDRSSSSTLSPPPTRRRKDPPKEAEIAEKNTDEFQQVTLPSFVDRYRVEGLGYGGDVYYQSDVCDVVTYAILIWC
jgi:hypothetical protein